MSTTHEELNQGFGAASTASTATSLAALAPSARQEGHPVDATAHRPPAPTTADAGLRRGAEEIRLEGVSKVYPDGTVGVRPSST